MGNDWYNVDSTDSDARCKQVWSDTCVKYGIKYAYFYNAAIVVPLNGRHISIAI